MIFTITILITECSMSYEKYTETLAMLNSDSNVYDHTPPPPSTKHPKDRHIRNRIIRSNHKCAIRIQACEGYLMPVFRLDLYQLNAPTRIFSAMHECLQTEDWKTMCQLILAAIKSTKASLMMYRAMLLQVKLR